MIKKLYSAIFLSLFLFGFSQRTEEIVRSYLSENNQKSVPFYGDFIIENEDLSKSLKSNVVKIQHVENGIPVFNSLATALIKDGKVIYFKENLEKDFFNISNSNPSLTAKTAFQKIENHFKINANEYSILNFYQSENGIQNFAKQRLTYFKKENQLKLSYEFIFPEKNTSNFWNVIVDANSAEILHQQNLTLTCRFNHDLNESHFHQNEFNFIEKKQENQQNQQNLSFKSIHNATYKVFPLPIESPNFGNRSLVSNPWFLDASPEGWHSDGNNHYTITRGNNVFAYEDQNALDSPGFSPDGGASRVFDSPLNLNSNNQSENLSASITNLFYVVNKSHDIFYRLGFNERARNFQVNNFGRGGVGNDPILAEAQDGEDLDNSNFAIAPEGTSSRLQMFMWNPSFVQHLFYNEPITAINRTPLSRTAQFGSSLTAAGITADVGIASVSDACTNLTASSLTGKIGLAERGNCNFTVKVKNIQEAGGVGAIIYNASTSPAIGNMGGTDNTITIPSILIENSEGEFIKNTLNNGTNVNVTLKYDPSNVVYADGSFDNGITIHEYAHGVSNRLTGNGYSCLNKNISAEQMGEGWSDFFALMFTNTNSTSSTTPRSIATFVAGENANGSGIRPAKYAPDFSVNDYTYGDTNGMEYDKDGEMVPDVHAIGFIWASILWDLHWKYAAKYGYNADIIENPNSGSAKITQLVMDAMKIQECNPTFISGRDAVLAADIASNNGENRCMIWETFAARGVGVDAKSGLKNSINDQVENFDLPYECRTQTTPLTEVSLYPNPANNEFNLAFPVENFGKTVIDIYDASGRLIKSEEKLVVTTRQTISISGFESGVYFVKVNGKNVAQTFRLMVRK